MISCFSCPCSVASKGDANSNWLPAGAVNATPLGAGAFRLDTGAEFSFLGESRAGEEVLDPVEHLDTFWFAIAAFDPDTRIAWA